MNCAFCEPPQDLKDRIFYDDKDKNWIACLAAPSHTKGHTILIRAQKCPKEINKTLLSGMGCALAEINETLLSGMGCALAKVNEVLMSYYCKPKPKRILLASLRGDIKHFHIHLIPLWEEEEKKWRKEPIENNQLCYEKGHLMEYLGYLEREGDKQASIDRNEKGWDHTEQRRKIAEELKDEIDSLRKKTEYEPA